jgi:hypothetical protein
MKTHLILASAVAGLCLVAGCARSPAPGQPAAGQPGAGLSTIASTQPAESLPPGEFWYQLARATRVTNDTATRALLLHLDDPAADAPYPQRIAALQERKLLPRNFNPPPQSSADRGDLAVAFCAMLDLKGGLMSRVLPRNPRYATRTLMFEGVYPDSTPQMGFTGSEFVGVIGAIDDRRRGNPTDLPAEQIPGYAEPTASLDGPPVHDYRVQPLVFTRPDRDVPLALMIQDSAAATPAGPATAAAPRKLRVFVTAVQGEQAEFRRTPTAEWEKARTGLVLDERAEFRTGDKSSIRFNIPPGQTFTVDRLSTVRVAEAAQSGNTVKTTVVMDQGRVRMDVNETAPGSRQQIQKVDDSAFDIAEAGVVHDTTIRSPNSALAVRGTKVSLYDQPPYAPRAVSLTGRADFLNTRRQIVPFGSTDRRSEVEGDQTSAAENAALLAAPQLPGSVIANNFDAAQLNRVLATGGFIRGDVIVGNASVDVNTDFKGTALGFVLSFGAPSSDSFQDLNLAVISPLSNATTPDFVANGPFTTALNPNAPGYEQFRAQFYPRTSPSGGAISRNAVTAPESLSSIGNTNFFRATEFANWPANYPQGTYRVVVTNFIDAVGDPPGKGSNPIPATVNVIVNGRSIGVLGGFNQPVGLYESLVLPFDTSQIPPSALRQGPPLRIKRK